MNVLEKKIKPKASSLITLVHFTVLYASRSYLSVIISHLGADGVVLGLPSIIYSLAQVILSIPCGRIVKRTGTRVPALIGSIFTCTSVFLLVFAKHWSVVVISALMLGLGHMQIILGTQSTAVQGGKLKETTGFIGMIMFASSAGMFIGPVLGGCIIDKFGFEGFALVSAIGLLAIPLALFMPGRNMSDIFPGDKNDEKSSVIGLIRTKNILLTVTISASILFCQETLTTYFPIYGMDIGISTTAVGTILGVRSISAMLIRPFLGVMANRFDIKTLMIASLIGSGVSIALYATLSDFGLLIGIAFISGIFMGIGTPLTITLIAIYVNSENRSEAISLRITCNYIGQGISAAFFGQMSTILGFSPIFFLSGLILLLAALVIKIYLPKEYK